MKFQLVVSAIIMLLLTSCGDKFFQDNAEVRFETDTETIKEYAAEQGLTLETDPTSGILYSKSVVNPTARASDLTFLQHLSYDLRVLNGVAIDSKTVADSAIFNYFNSTVIPGFLGAVLLLNEGEKGTFFIQSPLAYGQNPPGNLPQWAILKLELEAVAYFSEEDRINNYIEENGIEVDSISADGTRFIYTERVEDGDLLGSGDIVEVNYTGKFLNQETFDSGNLIANIGTEGLIPGFEKGLTGFKVGEKGTLIFPSTLGYGENGNSSILPYTPLIFDIEIVNKQ